MRSGLMSLVVLCGAFLLVSPRGARGDLWDCKDPTGRQWIVDEKGKAPKGSRCSLLMRTSPTAAPAPAAAGSGDRPAPRWTPPKAPQDPLPAAGPVPVAETTASPPPSDLDGIIRTAAATYDLPEAFLRAVITVESGYKLRALSHKGAMGLMQLMPGTARDLGVSDPWDPYENVMGGSRFLRLLADRFDGDMIKVISAYHAGGSVTSQRDGTPWIGTDGYVRKVLKNYYRLKREAAAATPVP